MPKWTIASSPATLGQFLILRWVLTERAWADVVYHRTRSSDKAEVQLTVDKVISEEMLRQVWKAVKKSYHDQLIRDPLDLLAFEANLDTNLKQLEFTIRDNRYRPIPHTVVRAAKRDGMTRPLSFLEITDTLVLKAITDAMQGVLHKGFPSCVGFARSQQKSFDTDEEDYETWIQAWLRHQRVVKDLLEQKGCEWVVESDIGNFFLSVNHRPLHQLVAQRTGAEERLINLLFFILESMTWRPAYSENRHVGLPQENYDASRILAHAFLQPVDMRFQSEIEGGRYARWVDDFVIAVPNPQEGRSVLRRLEQALEDRGLFPNSAKSKVVKAQDFVESLYPEWNAFLDRVHESTKNLHKKHDISRSTFDKKLNAFLGIPEKERLKTWDRVLRRFYTESRRIGSAILENHAIRHLREFSACAPKIMSYLLGRPFSRELLQDILAYLKSQDNIYQDVEIWVYEFLLAWCFPADSAVTQLVADNCLDHFFARNSHPKPLTEHARGLISLMLYKFGTTHHIAELAKAFFTNRVHDPTFARYVICVLAGTDTYREDAFAAAEKFEDRAMRRLHSFLTTVAREPQAFKNTLKQYVTAQKRTPPTYFFFPARMLPLVRLVRTNRPFRLEWDRYLGSVVKRLKSSEQPLYDEKSIQFIAQEISRP